MIKDQRRYQYYMSFIFIYIQVPGLELRASHILGRHSTTCATLPALFIFFLWYWDLNLVGKHSTTWARLPALFTLDYFSDMVSIFCLGQPSTLILLSVTPYMLGLQVCTTTPRLFIKIGDLPLTTVLLISTSQVPGITGVNCT
jgi:hypothetical protein